MYAGQHESSNGGMVAGCSTVAAVGRWHGMARCIRPRAEWTATAAPHLLLHDLLDNVGPCGGRRRGVVRAVDWRSDLIQAAHASSKRHALQTKGPSASLPGKGEVFLPGAAGGCERLVDLHDGVHIPLLRHVLNNELPVGLATEILPHSAEVRAGRHAGDVTHIHAAEGGKLLLE
jgi:hypothetical protein